MLNGKNAVVTGANGGIGRAIVETMAKNGCGVWACARKENQELEAFLRSVSERWGTRAEPVYFDLCDSAQTKAGVKRIVGDRLPIDVLVNNAGVARYGAFALLSEDTMRETFEANYFAPLRLTQMLARRMAGGASILFLSSVAGLDGQEGNTAYGGSKAAIALTTRVLSRELAGMNIRVNAVAPGMVDTAMKEKADSETWRELVGRTALKREARPEEIANVVCFLASDLASYITGQVIRVDGGM